MNNLTKCFFIYGEIRRHFCESIKTVIYNEHTEVENRK